MDASRTSVSDTARYNLVCAKAAWDDLFFEVFRRHPAYMQIVETLDARSAMDFLNLALANCPHYLANVEEFRRNESVGGPLLVNFPTVGVFAPSTLRYIKVASDIERFFGNLNGLRVAEVGAGYGGQCRILACLNRFESYTLFDLPSPSRLARRYLDCFAVPNVVIGDIFAEHARRYDLVISN